MSNKKIFKTVLRNGLTVLVKENNLISNVAINMWYNVGAQDEESTMRGYAHIVEHMIFKGTQKTLSESDIIETIHKLGGECNATTTHNFTYYTFEIPYTQWYESLYLLAESMHNCNFKQDFINSEFKAVIQELKKTQEDYTEFLSVLLSSEFFPNHPYQYPVIGTKQDIMNVTADSLNLFYKKYYAPNNATLVIVGNVDTQQALKHIKKAFSSLKKNKQLKKREYDIEEDMISKTIELYRNIPDTQVQLAFRIPGFGSRENCHFDLIADLFFNSMQSRIYKKLVNELRLVDNLTSFKFNLFVQDIFFIQFQPTNPKKINKIIAIINNEMQDIIKNGIYLVEKERITTSLKVNYNQLLYDNAEQNDLIGSHFLATGNPNFIFEYYTSDFMAIEVEIQNMLQKFYHPSFVYKGFLLPIPQDEKDKLIELRQQADKHDFNYFTIKKRSSTGSIDKFAHSVIVKPFPISDIPTYHTFLLDNGMKVIYYHDKTVPLITMQLELKASNEYDPDSLEGMYNFMINLLFKEAKNVNHESVSIKTTIPSEQLERNLILLGRTFMKPRFKKKDIEILKNIITSQIKDCDNDTACLSKKFVQEKIYRDHPYAKNQIGTPESIKKITKDKLMHFYKNYITPQDAKLVIVGDLESYNIQEIVKRTLGDWHGPSIKNIHYPKLKVLDTREILYEMDKDQTRLTYAGLSLSKKGIDFYALKIFEDILTASMKGKLFEIREETGLFYNIEGSLTRDSGRVRGYIYISTLVYPYNLTKLEKIIDHLIKKAPESITQQEMNQSKNMIVHSFVDNFSSHEKMISTLLFLSTNNYANDYYRKKAEEIKQITLEEVQKIAKKVFNKKNIFKVKIGRL